MHDNSPPPPKIFVCCQLCREHPPGSSCNHAQLDGCEYRETIAYELHSHEGCTCVWAEKTLVRTKLPG